MNPRVFLDVDPRTLRVPPSRSSGADPMIASQTNELLGAISELRLIFPDWRMGQGSSARVNFNVAAVAA
jgi:hypothetical protein